MRVLHLAGGSVDSRYFETLTRGLTDRGVDVLCGTVARSTPPEWLDQTDGASHFSLDAPGGGRRWLLPATFELVRLIRRDRIDIVQTHLFEPGMVGAAAGRIAGRPVIVTRHHTDEHQLFGTRVHTACDRLTAYAATRVLGFSNAVRDHLVAHEGVDPAKVEVIHQGFDFETMVARPDRVERTREEFGLDGRFVIGDVARVSKTKGQRDLLRAARILSEPIDDLAVLIVGGGDLDELRAVAGAEGVLDRTVIAGHRNDVESCYGAMDVVVHPSLTEAFCQVLIEAMAAGRPLIASDVAGAPEVIDHGSTGLLVPPRSPEAIVAAVRSLHEDPMLRSRMAMAGQDSVRNRFPAELMVEKQVAMYRRVLSLSP